MVPLPVDASALPADAGTLDVLARLALRSRRQGHGLQLRGASRDLCALIAFAGLAGVLGLEAEREAEELEERLGLEEERELGEPPA